MSFHPNQLEIQLDILLVIMVKKEFNSEQNIVKTYHNYPGFLRDIAVLTKAAWKSNLVGTDNSAGIPKCFRYFNSAIAYIGFANSVASVLQGKPYSFNSFDFSDSTCCSSLLSFHTREQCWVVH